MKKLIALLLCLVMVLSLAACGDKKETTTDKGGDKTTVEVPASSLEILEKVWGEYAEDEKFPVMGGDFENIVDGAPGEFNIADTENLMYSLLVPEAEIEKIDGAASLIHAMMTNNFTCGVFHLKNASDAKGFAEAMGEAVQNNRWMCGMPESLLVAVIGGEYVLMAYGIGDAMGPFETHLTAVYPDAELVCDEAIAG